jgi:hypothetical protein
MSVIVTSAGGTQKPNKPVKTKDTKKEK